MKWHLGLLVCTMFAFACANRTTGRGDGLDGSQDAAAGEDMDADSESDSDGGALLVLDSILDINGVVTTKGMDVTANGSTVYLWNYNQDNLEFWDGAALEVLADTGLISGYGTDLAVDGDGDVYVTKGGDTSGETIMKWGGASGDVLWGAEGIAIKDGLLLGVTKSVVAATEYIYVGDGRVAGGLIHKLSREDGSILGSVPVQGKPLDVAVDADENYYLLSSAVSNPLITGDHVFLRKYDKDGAQEGEDVQLDGALYITLAADGRLYVSCSSFDFDRRKIYVFETDLAPVGDVNLPAEYIGHAGGIATYGKGDALRILVSAQKGVGSDPICDVLVYKKPV